MNPILPLSSNTQRLDFIRGIVVLAIFLLNPQWIVTAIYTDPMHLADLTQFQYWMLGFAYLFTKGSFWPIFSLLFGASTFLFIQQLEQNVHPIYWRYYRRCVVLLLIGLLLTSLIFQYGYLLITYAICASWIVLLRHSSINRFIGLGSFFLFIGYANEFYLALTMSESIALEQRIGRSSTIQHLLITVHPYLTTSGLMLLGMAFVKSGIFTGTRTTTFYQTWMLTFFITGLIIGVISLYGLTHQSEVNIALLVFNTITHFSSLLVALGYIGGMILMSQSARLQTLRHLLCGVGTMTFTYFVLQTLLCFILFYHHGFGLFNHLPLLGQAIIVILVWFLLILGSKKWLQHFQYGPIEWLWRSLTDWAWQSMKRSSNNRMK